MNKLIFFLLGAAAGTGVTYFIMRKKVKALTDEISHRDGEDADAFRKRLEKEVTGEPAEEMSEEELLKYYMDGLKDLGVDFTFVEEPVEESREEVNPLEDDSPEDDDVAVYPIQKVLYDAGKSDYSKERLAYYAGDKVFVDLESNEPIDNWRQYLGDTFDFEKADFKPDDTIYIRNEALESDFEIVLRKGSFAGPEEDDDENLGDFAD